MAPLTVRPSLRQAHLLSGLCLIPLAALFWYVFRVAPGSSRLVLLLALLPFFFPLKMYASSLSTVLTVDAGAVRFRQGLFSQTDRAMNLSRVQDVTVQRSFWQRLWGIGDIMIESASESGRIVITDIDHPRQVADLILAASRDARTSS